MKHFGSGSHFVVDFVSGASCLAPLTPPPSPPLRQSNYNNLTCHSRKLKNDSLLIRLNSFWISGVNTCKHDNQEQPVSQTVAERQPVVFVAKTKTSKLQLLRALASG